MSAISSRGAVSGGQQRGRAEAPVGAGDGGEGVAAFHDVAAAAAVHIQVDEAWQQVRIGVAGRVAGLAFDPLDTPVLDVQAAEDPALRG